MSTFDLSKRSSSATKFKRFSSSNYLSKYSKRNSYYWRLLSSEYRWLKIMHYVQFTGFSVNFFKLLLTAVSLLFVSYRFMFLDNPPIFWTEVTFLRSQFSDSSNAALSEFSMPLILHEDACKFRLRWKKAVRNKKDQRL